MKCKDCEDYQYCRVKHDLRSKRHRCEKAKASLPAQTHPDKKLQQAIKLLEAEYNRARKCEFVNNPIAYALYHTWKKIEEANQ